MPKDPGYLPSARPTEHHGAAISAGGIHSTRRGKDPPEPVVTDLRSMNYQHRRELLKFYAAADGPTQTSRYSVFRQRAMPRLSPPILVTRGQGVCRRCCSSRGVRRSFPTLKPHGNHAKRKLGWEMPAKWTLAADLVTSGDWHGRETDRSSMTTAWRLLPKPLCFSRSSCLPIPSTRWRMGKWPRCCDGCRCRIPERARSVYLLAAAWDLAVLP